MNTLILQPTVIADWQALVKEAEDASHYSLSEDLESYLVFLLMRFMGKPEIAKSVLALDFLHSLEQVGQQKKVLQLHEVGDKCLLFAGLFPGRAEQRHVRISYFVELGQSAYAELATLNKQKLAELYLALEEGFVMLMDVLHVIREFAGEQTGLTPLQAEELWCDTGSVHALTVLRRTTTAMLLQREICIKGMH